MKFSKAFIVKSQETLPSSSVLTSLLPQLVQAAQKEYDEWQQDAEGNDEMLGSGGICQEIADAICDVLSRNNIDCMHVSAQVGEQHVWTVAKFEEGVYEIDIHPSYYETGGGYNWKKIPDVVFDDEMISIGRLSSDPNEFEKFGDY